MMRAGPKFDVVALGELVIDLVPQAELGAMVYAAKPGGAPANLAAGISRLGLTSALIGSVGDEAFGKSALEALASTGVSVAGVSRSQRHNTPVAVVSHEPGGGASYFFYRENSADTNLVLEPHALEIIAASRILHVGTLFLATPVSADSQRRAIAHAKSVGVRISTDVNFRRAFWPNEADMRAAGLEMIAAATLVKVSRDELLVLTAQDSTEAGVRSLWHPDLIAMAVTDGASGAIVITRGEAVSVPAYAVDVVDAVGCGDAFWASLLASMAALDFVPPRGAALRTMVQTACAAGAVVAMRSGALTSMPRAAEIDDFLKAAS